MNLILKKMYCKFRRYQYKTLLIFLLALIFFKTANAQNRKVAVFNPVGNTVEQFLKDIVREEISSVIVNIKGYTVLERHLIDQVLLENEYQASGLVDDTEISEAGKHLGANLVCVTSVNRLNSNNIYISFKLIDVQTARIERQNTTQTKQESLDLAKVVKFAVYEMFGIQITDTDIKMTLAKRKFFLDGLEIEKNEVRNKIKLNSEALELYDKGKKTNKWGNICLVATPIIFTTGTILSFLGAPNYDVVYENGQAYKVYTYYGSTEILISSACIFATAIILKVNAKRKIQKSVDIYNGGVKTVSNDIHLGFSKNGVKLTLNF